MRNLKPQNPLILSTLKKRWFKELSNHAQLWLVGGIVRDELINRFHGSKLESKDVDLCVVGLNLEEIEALMKPFGVVKRQNVGGTLATLKFAPKEGLDGGEEIDLVIPRSEVSTGARKKDFKFDFSNVSLEKDFERRDLTINAIGWNANTFEIFDPFNGVKDIKNGVIHALSKQSFVDDPTRMMRAIQFAQRFKHLGFEISEATTKWIVQLGHLTRKESGERLFGELKKMWAKAKDRSAILEDNTVLLLLELALNPRENIVAKPVDTFSEFLFLICKDVDNFKEKLKMDNQNASFIDAMLKANTLLTLDGLRRAVSINKDIRFSRLLENPFRVTAHLPLTPNELPKVDGMTQAQWLISQGFKGAEITNEINRIIADIHTNALRDFK